MKTVSLLSLFAVLWTLAAPGMTQEARSGRAVFRSGDWYVVHSTQKATGAVACTGYQIGHPGAQLGKDSLSVKIAGEPKSIVLRFGDEPARAPRPAQKAEAQAGAVMLAGADFEQLRRSKTMELDVATAQGRVRETLNLGGLDATLKNIDAGCPLPAALVRAERKAQLAREKAAKARCEPAGVARMREKGVPEWRIAATCPKAAPAPGR